jgi:hypothetical protein
VVVVTSGDAIYQLLTTAANYKSGGSSCNQVLAAAYRLAAAKLHEDGNPDQAADMERTAALMERM